jgi:hypothetical protein
LAVLASSVPAWSSVIRSAGRITFVSGDPIVVIHLDRSREPAFGGHPLYPGDRFEIVGASKLFASVYGEPKHYDAASADKSVPLRDVGVFSKDDESFLDRFALFMSKPRKSIPSFSWIRDGSGRPAQPTTLSALAPFGRQCVEADTHFVALIWARGAGEVAVSRDGGPPVAIEVRKEPWAVVPLQRGEKSAAITLKGLPGAWAVERCQRAPLAKWQIPTGSLSEAQRVTRAAWLLSTDAYPEWRLFALSELKALADHGNFAARELWQAARSGELLDTLQAQPPGDDSATPGTGKSSGPGQ